MDRIELASGETSVTICIAVRRPRVVGKMIQEQRGKEERGRTKQLRRGEY
jgi:hypothetical protein